MAFSDELRAKAEELIGRYPGKRSALLPLLHLVMHADGHLSDEGITECADLLGLTKAEVAAVATFYTMYKREPVGRHLVSVCTNFACKVRGADEVYRHLSDKLGVGHNETTADGAVTLEHAECLGNCEGAPVVTVDYLNYEGMTPEAAGELVDALVRGETPPPTRGFAPPGARQVHHRLAGLGPAPGDANPGVASSHARDTDGGLPPVESGPGLAPVTVLPTFAEGEFQERERAMELVRSLGAEPDRLAEQAGPRAREFPSTAPDWAPQRPGERLAAATAAPEDDGDEGEERRDG